MTDNSTTTRNLKIEWLLEEIRNAVRTGVSVDAAVERISNNPFVKPPEDLLNEARIIFLQNAGQISKFKAVDSLIQDEVDSGDWYDGPDYDNHIYWPHVKEVLQPKLGSALDDVDKASSKVLCSLRPPAEDAFDVRGLVLGFVQSGKTTNFISLISKAADIGYRLIIVLAGMTDNLRIQTQKRINEQLIDETPNWVKLTDIDSDFNASQFNANNRNSDTLLGAPANRHIAVVKKNGHILTALNNFLQGAKIATKDLPILVIDDESDQASINVSPKAKAEASKINAQIKTLLRNPKTAYVAYTATPFANILIDPNDTTDLYPKDFIHVLPKPEGYFGTETIFGREPLNGEDAEELDGLSMVRTIDEDEIGATRPPSGKKGFENWEPEIPKSLDEAIRWFILATAARRARGQKDAHSSMLIHTAVRTAAHEILHELVQEQVKFLARKQDDPEMLKLLEAQWVYETEQVSAEALGYETLTFEEIKPHISDVLKATEVVMDNGVSEQRLQYEDGKPKTVIAVGGNTLSRGLTLEGLVCSYFVRNATAYDTLLQMGRWFGFRNGYGDLPRIWMTEELENWFHDLALVEADLRKDLARYADDGETPLTFQARIRTHPSMEVTARAKQQNSRPAVVSYSGQKVQTILFRHKNKDWLSQNIQAAESLVQDIHGKGLKEHQKKNGTKFFKQVPPSVVEKFLDEYAIYEESTLGRNNAELLKAYIKKEHSTGSIRAWDISFFGRSGSDRPKSIDLGLTSELNLLNRSQMVVSASPDVANIKTLVGSLDRLNSADLDKPALQELIDEFETQSTKAETKLLKAYEAAVGTDVAHLGIYAIDPDSKTSQSSDFVHKSGKNVGKLITPRNRRKDLNAEDVMIGIGLFFPTSSNPDPDAEYVSAQDFLDAETMEQVAEAESEVLQAIESEEV